ncbi:MAG: LytTR family DNA-binding domain-containing protein [Bacteroidia bacterium]|nr:LytTR family DNA-binding domain-containing protein [Bacteroidia bacterium]
MNREYTVLIADDEAPARAKLLHLLNQFPQLKVINQSANGLEALENIISLKPQIAFLDIEMPGLSGLEVARNLPPETETAIVFATAYNEHAITAFELNALDYLLKPFNAERLAITLDKIDKAQKASVEELQKNLDELPPVLLSLNKIPVPVADRFKLLDYDEVYCIEVEERNTLIYTVDKSYIVNLPLDHFEKKLPQKFIRVSRSAIINLEAVKEIVIWFGNRYKIILQNKKEVICSREKSKLLKQFLKF